LFLLTFGYPYSDDSKFPFVRLKETKNKFAGALFVADNVEKFNEAFSTSGFRPISSFTNVIGISNRLTKMGVTSI